MTLAHRVLRGLASRRIVRCLTGETKDLRTLLNLRKLPIHNPGLNAFLATLERDLETGTGLAGILLHVGRHANARQKQRLIGNLAFRWTLDGGRIRTALRANGQWVPFIVVISPTMRCNLKCRGCYSALYRKDGELSEDELDRLLTECTRIGVHFVVLTGGEPYLLGDALLRVFRKHRDIFFLTFTNGTLIDDRVAAELGRLGNVAPGISVEGYAEQTDARRGSGVHEKALQAMDRLRREGVLFGISVTYTRENVDVVTDERFVEYYLGVGSLFAWYFMFMPVGSDPVLDLVPTPEQRVACGQRVASLRKRYPLFMADFWNDGPAAGGCLAAGRRYLHVLNSGRVEPCVYAHFGVDNIRTSSLLEAANSPFFRAIRREFPFNALGNLKRPCMIIDNPEVLRRLVAEHVVPAGHAHAEDILRDPKVVQWVDAYSARFRELTDPAWSEIIDNPASRWSREKEEYRNLFRFQASRHETAPAEPGAQ